VGAARPRLGVGGPAGRRPGRRSAAGGAPGSLDEAELPGAVAAPGGEYLGVHTREPRAEVIAILRAGDRGLVRWIRGARTVAWSDDGRLMALGGDWGVILAETVS